MIKWGLYLDKGHWVIRRGAERLPVSQYSRIRNDEALLRALVLQLNAPLRIREKLAFQHSLVNEERLEEYLGWLLIQVPNQFNARCEFQFLRKHCLNFFFGRQSLYTPLDWLRIHDTKWAAYLLSDEVPPSPKTKRAIIQAANRFIKWMHKKFPEFMPEMKLEPLSQAVFKEMRADWDKDERRIRRDFIPDEIWARIKKNLPPEIEYRVLLAYHYGLRRREALGVLPGDVKNNYLAVTRQLFRITPEPKYGALKGREDRKTPHWFTTNAVAYGWVEKAAERRLITPTDFSDTWTEYMKVLDLKYDLHDLRHTFITKAMRKKKPVEVMWAVGHKNIETTMRYLHDDRALGDEEYRPA